MTFPDAKCVVPEAGPSDTQLFGPLAIYKHYERSKRLARDLETAFLPSDYYSSPGALQQPFGILFVARDGITEDADEASQSKRKKFPRYYHPSFIEQFAFSPETSSDERKPLADWIINAASKLEKPVQFTAEEIRWILSELLPTGTGCSKPEQGLLTAEDAFECLVEAYSHQKYTGGTPLVLDTEILNAGAAPIFFIPWSQTHNDDGTPDPLIILQSLESADVHWHDHNEGKKIKADLFDLATASALDEQQKDVARRFFTFTDAFFRDTRQRHGVEKSFHGLVFPLYDRWEAANPLGGFLGWVFLHIPGTPLRQHVADCLCHNDAKTRLLYREVLRANLNDFADSVSEHLMDEELESFAVGSRHPMEFFRLRFHHIEGWIGGKELADLPEKQEFHRFTNKQLTVRLDGKTCVTLTPKWDSAIPSIIPNDYLLRIALWARTLWESLHQLVEQRNVGRAVAAEESYTKNAHQIRKLCERINKDSSKETLDTLRRYFSLTFLSPKNLQGGALIRLTSEIYGGGGFGEYFLEGTTIQELIHASYEYARRIYPVMLNAHNDAGSTIVLPIRTLTFDNVPDFQQRIWQHESFAERLSTTLTTADENERLRLQVKVFWFTSLIALWLNILEHSPAESEIHLTASDGMLQVSNRAKQAVKEGASQHRSHGTEQTLSYYYKHCFPEGAISGNVEFPFTPTDNVFTTKLPIPNYSYLCAT